MPALKDTQNPSVAATNLGTATQNYVIENVHLDPVGTSVAQHINYFDGLGRPVQSVSVATGGVAFGSNVEQDVVSISVYDGFGREAVKNLPYANPTAAAKGGFRMGNLEPNIAIYQASLGKIGTAYASTVYEASPLNRVLESTAAGNTVSVKMTYRTNVAGEVKLLTYNFGTGNIDVTDYLANELIVTEISNENSQITIEYKDKKGQVVCKNTSGLITYYCYDCFGWLRCVVPPKASVTGSFDAFANELLFAYDYDTRGRLIRKKVASAGTTAMEYSNRDLLSKTTDSNGNIVLTQYDGLNRPTKTTRGDGVVLTESFYDNYSFVGAKTADNTTGIAFAQITSPQGMPTGTRVRNMDAGTMLASTTMYDELGRVVQILADNHLGTTDITTLQLDFAGRSERTILNSRGLTIENRTTYDRGSRTKAICQKISDPTVLTPLQGQGAYWEPLARMGYDGIGELSTKTLGCNLQKIDYQYDMHGWLKSVNDPANLVANKDLFGMSLQYDAVGNITNQNYATTQQKNKVGQPFLLDITKQYQYSYSYDNLNRLLTANLKEQGLAIFALSNMNYDPNGNIKTLNRTWQGANVDVLNYAYANANNSNQIASVADNGTVDANFYSPTAGQTSYAYDANGNTTKDSGKNISTIGYNYLNLPTQILQAGKTITYSYTASGQKLSTTFGDVGLPTSTKYDYMAAGVYKNGTLEFIPTAEGRFVIKTPTTGPKVGLYEYHLKDHLGNLRVACACDTILKVTQIAHQDPWGVSLPIGLKGTNRFLFTGKETQPETGYIDFGARQYDANVPHFLTVDEKAEKFYPLSGYNYVANNPVLINDTDGKDWTMTKTEDKDGNVHYQMMFRGVIYDGRKDKSNKINMTDLFYAVKAQIENKFNSVIENENGTKTIIETSVNLRIATDANNINDYETMIALADSDHPELGSTTAGKALDGLNVILNSDFVASKDKNYNMLDSWGDMNSKTIPHEVGHTAGLKHPAMDYSIHFGNNNNPSKKGYQHRLNPGPTAFLELKKNFMNQGNNTQNTNGITKEQIERIYRLYSTGKLNSNNISPVSEK